jgi:hypothetical protein
MRPSPGRPYDRAIAYCDALLSILPAASFPPLRLARRILLCLLVIAPVFLLTGCHADVTTRVEVRGDGTALVTTKEIIDDQLYKLALSQNTNGDPFGAEQMQRKGWTVSSASGNDGNHVITISRLFGGSDLKDFSSATPVLTGGVLPLGQVHFSRSSSGLFSERDSLSATIPALLPLASSTISRFYAGVALALVAPVVTAYLEVKTPGTISATNGEIMPDGFVRWNLNLQEPTTIQYSATMINFWHVAVGIFIALVVLVTITILRTRYAGPLLDEKPS